MSSVKANNHQIGQSATAANNFTLYQPATPDGTVRLGVGNAGATTADVITASSTGVTIPSVSSNNTFGFKNRIINGGMVISQAAAGSQVVFGGTYPVDRWRPDASFNNSWGFQQNAGSVTPPAGFSNYVGFTNGTAYSVAATDNLLLSQAIEGYNIADLAWGTANAKSVTLSFWVRSSITGQHGGVLTNNTGRTYPFAYTISAANTWTYITVTIPGDTSGTWLANNGIGLRIYFGLAEGSSNVAAAGSWYAGTYYGASGSVSLAATAGATFYITGVQLEVGSQATSFDFRSYGTELALCQRYYNVYVNGGIDFQQEVNRYALTGCSFTWWLPVTMRASPSIYLSTGTAGSYGRLVAYDASLNLTATPNVSAISFGNSANNQSVTFNLTNASLGATPYVSYDTAGAVVVIAATAEL